MKSFPDCDPILRLVRRQKRACELDLGIDEPRVQRFELRASLRKRSAVLEPSENLNNGSHRARFGNPQLVSRDGNSHVGTFLDLNAVESSRQHANYGKRKSAQAYASPQYITPPAKSALPESVAEHYRIRGCLFVSVSGQTSEERIDPQRAIVIPRHKLARNIFNLVAGLKGHLQAAGGEHRKSLHSFPQ